MKRIFFVIILCLFCYWGYSTLSKRSEAVISKPKSELTEKRIKDEIQSAKAFIAKNQNYNSEIVFLADMKIMSGKNRFFIYDLKKDKIIDEGLVAHGSGSETGIENNLKFSNEDNSLATSLGRYSIGESYHGRFGKAYKLYGLDKTNSNAFLRNIVLHKYSKMPYEEQLDPVCNSLGCPMVNETYFKRIEKIIDSSKKKILLDIYY